ncbi:MAG TPA: phage/plasmid primase, P4 family [Candidatus Acidoferrales bacterium]|nr:phage/plasmid primase, P4 family [Candidatus Acidoferrales bacterium]
MNSLDSILPLARDEGWRLFPVRERAKVPAISDWPNQASSDEKQLLLWAEQYPRANWGLATGSPSNVFAVDADGVEGALWIEQQRELHGDGWTGTRTSETARGRHLFFRLPKNTAVRNSVGAIAPGIDIRGEGGFVVVPPSTHESGATYQWSSATAAVLDAPSWLLEAATSVSKSVVAMPPVNGNGRILSGARNSTLTSLAGSMRRKGASDASIAAALAIENKTACDPPLASDEVATIAASISRYPAAASDDLLTQDALAEALIAREPNLRYVHELGRWFIFDGAAWREDKTRMVFNRIREAMRDFRASHSDSRMARESARTYSAVETIAAAHPACALSVEQLDANPDLLNTPMGTVDRRTGGMRPANAADYLTKSTAVAPGGDCPLWHEFLKRVTKGDEYLAHYLQRLAFYCLWGSTEQDSIFYLYGNGANGKSTFLTNLAGALGDYAVTAPPEVFMRASATQHPTGIARLRGARLVCTSEIPEGRWNEEFLKSISGGGKLTGRFMRQDFFEFTPRFKLVVTGNTKPGLRVVDPAMRRRFNLIPFTATFAPDEIDRELRDIKLPREWPGILQWALDGREEFLRQGLNPPECVREASAEYLDEEDKAGRWLADCCVAAPDRRVSAGALYVSFREWCEEAGESFTPSQKWLARELKKRGFTPHNDGRARQWIGLGLRQIGEV